MSCRSAAASGARVMQCAYSKCLSFLLHHDQGRGLHILTCFHLTMPACLQEAGCTSRQTAFQLQTSPSPQLLASSLASSSCRYCTLACLTTCVLAWHDQACSSNSPLHCILPCLVSL